MLLSNVKVDQVGREGGRNRRKEGGKVITLYQTCLKYCNDVGNDKQDKEDERPQGLVRHGFLLDWCCWFWRATLSPELERGKGRKGVVEIRE